MEDFGTILWVIFLAASILIPVVTKAMETKKQVQSPKKATQGKHPRQTEEIQPETPLYQSQMAHKQGMRAAVGNKSQIDTIAQNMSEEAHSEQSLGEFDLRQAVIYSEILKPKFDE